MAAKSKSDTYLYIRVNSDLKESFREVCENSGMTSSGALKQFMASSVREGRPVLGMQVAPGYAIVRIDESDRVGVGE